MPSNKQILIVEDEPSILEPLVSKFKQKGYVVQSAKNGQEGLAMARQLHPDLILLDLVMPVMDGITMLKQLRAESEGKQVQVMVLSNVNDVSKASETAGLGITDYIVKSDWKLNDIVARVAEKLGD